MRVLLLLSALLALPACLSTGGPYAGTGLQAEIAENVSRCGQPSC